MWTRAHPLFGTRGPRCRGGWRLAAWAMVHPAIAAAQADQAAGRTFEDACGDACIRRTDPGVDGELAGDTPPDLLRFHLRGWEPASVSQPFEGRFVKTKKSGILRVDVTFAGLVSPPGRVDPTGWHHDPAPFGGTPAYGYLDINVDADRDTGGELDAPARERYLANIARFGGLPPGERWERAAQWHGHLDDDFSSEPQFERSGADFTFTLCGCEQPVVLSAGGNGDLVFEEGETWLLEGRYFVRAGGYCDASGVFGGSDFGTYDPPITMRVAHDPSADETTFSVLFPVMPKGAAYLAGEPEQPIDQIIGIGGSHFSMQEALQDLVWGAQGYNGLAFADSVRVLIDPWKNKDPDDHLDPMKWKAAAIFGMAYAQPEPSRFAWTDLGGPCGPIGDLNNDGLVDEHDHKVFVDLIALLDGGEYDADGNANGVVVVQGFGPGFFLIDFNADGRVDHADEAVFGAVCRADFNDVNGVTVQDIFDFLTAWLAGSTSADFNGVNGVTVQDIFDFLTAWLAGC